MPDIVYCILIIVELGKKAPLLSVWGLDEREGPSDHSHPWLTQIIPRFVPHHLVVSDVTPLAVAHV